MRCNNCGAVNPVGAHFCGHCGVAVEIPANEESNPRREEPIGETFCAGTPAASRSLSELLAESARVYRNHLTIFLGIGAIPQIPGLLGLGLIPLWWEITLIITSLVLTALTFGAITRAAAADFAGLTPTFGSSYTAAMQRSANLVVCLFLHMVLLGISLLLSLLLVGIPMLLLLLVLLWFYPQVIMVEHKGPVDAFRRSILLVQGGWWRLFGIGIAYFALPVALVITVVTLFNDPNNSKLVGLVSAVIVTVTTPWIFIGSTLTYIDLRVRKEGYSIESLKTELEWTGPE